MSNKVCLLLFYILLPYKVISGRGSTCDSSHSWWLYRAALLGHHMTSHDLLSHSVSLFWHWTNQSLPYPNNAEHWARKWRVSILKSLVWLDQVKKCEGRIWTCDLRISRSPRMGGGCSLLMRLLRLISRWCSERPAVGAQSLGAWWQCSRLA